MDAQVSSLYGPGAIICWLCTSAAVFLSWSLNQSSRRYDTITGDVVACLLLPVIALCHLLHEISHATRTEDWTATPTMDATFAICMAFVPFSLVLCCIACFDGHLKRLILMTVVTMACLVMVLIGCNANGRNVPHFDRNNAGLPFLLSLCIGYIGYVLLMHQAFLQSRDRLIIQEHFSKRSGQILRTMGVSVVWSVVSFAGFSAYFRPGDKFEDDKPIVRRILPRTGYSIREIDQAVALGVGIVTLLLCIHDIIQGYRFSIDDEFEGWTRRCIMKIELGDGDVEMARWTTELDRIDKKAKCARTRARHRERALNTFHELPVVVKLHVGAYKVQRNLKLLIG
jgi:hypothetical protein